MSFNFDEFTGSIKRLQEAQELLHLVWVDIGPYNQDKVSPATLQKLNDFFDFDDSE